MELNKVRSFIFYSPLAFLFVFYFSLNSEQDVSTLPVQVAQLPVTTELNTQKVCDYTSLQSLPNIQNIQNIQDDQEGLEGQSARGVSSLGIMAKKTSTEHWIITHGTFGQKMSWHKPGGDFFNAIEARVTLKNPKAKVHSFVWSGSNSHSARLKASKELFEFIKTIYTPGDKLNLVGHSHGANVLLACVQNLAEEKSSIVVDQLFALGVPVQTLWYVPVMTNLKKLYNLFSYADFVQPVARLFNRVFPEQPGVHNIQIKIDHLCPSHSELHESIIGCYLPELQKLIPHEQPHCIVFFKNQTKKPEVMVDLNREKDLKIDADFTTQMLASISESRYVQRYKTAYNEFNFTPKSAKAIGSESASNHEDRLI